MKLVILLVSVSLASAQFPFPKLFVVEQGVTPKLTCSQGGGTCRFDGLDFSSGLIEPDNGGTTQVIPDENGIKRTVWGPQENFAEDFLLLPQCKPESCFIKCQEVCTCALPDGTECTESSAFPTASPVAGGPSQPPPVVCAAATDVTSCPQLMKKLPVGVDCSCHNFCEGEFLSCEGGNVTCATDLPDGHMMGKVLGCTVAHRDQGVGGSGGSSGSFKVPLAATTMMVVVISGRFLW